MSLVRFNEKHGYKTSRDYERLYQELQSRSLICILKHGMKTTVADTIWNGEVAQVSSPGLCYIFGVNKGDFISQCSLLDLEWIDPCGDSDER